MTSSRLAMLAALIFVASCSDQNTVSAGFLGLKREPVAGYAWKYPDSYFSTEVEWRPGTRHPDHAHARAAANERSWTPDPGYRFTRTGDLSSAAWSPGTPHPTFPHAQAAASEGRWTVEPGYRLTRQNDPSSTTWTPGARHGGYPHARAHATEGSWSPDPGYQFARLDDPGSAAWSPGTRHSLYPHARADLAEGYWAPDPGYRFTRLDDARTAIWSPGIRHSTYPNIFASLVENQWVADSGYRFVTSVPGDLRVEPISAPVQMASRSSPGSSDIPRRIVHVVARACARPQDDDNGWETIGRIACALTALGTSSPGD